MLNKVLVLVLNFIILSSLMCACQTQQAQDKETTDNSACITETSEMAEIPLWKTAYLSFLKTKKDSHCSYALVYIDGDDIPELYLSGNGEATGDSICSYKNGAVVEQPLRRIGGGRYIEKSGNIMNQNGNMGRLYTHVYELSKDGFELTFDALSSECVEVLENGEYKRYYEYSIENKPTSESEYNAAVKASFDFDNSISLYENSVNYSAIRQQIIDCN